MTQPKTFRILLLILGIAGTIWSVFLMFANDDQRFSLTGLVFGSFLIYSYFNIQRKKDKQAG